MAPTPVPSSGYASISHPFRSRRGLRQGGLTLLVPPPSIGRRPPFVFVISSVASFQCPLPTKGVGSAKVATFSRSAKSPWGFFRGGNRRSPFAVAKVLPFFPTNQIFSQLFSKKICTFSPIHCPPATYAAKKSPRFYAIKHAPAAKPQKNDLNS